MRYKKVVLPLLGVAGIIGFCACPHPIKEEVKTQQVTVLDVPGWPVNGQTLCNGDHPLIILKAPMDDSTRMSVVQHELHHSKQMSRMGGCLKASLRYRDDSDFRFATEADAYCTELRWWTTNTKRTYDELALRLITFLSLTYGKELEAEDVIHRFKIICPRR